MMAKNACKEAGEKVVYYFVDIRKMIELANGAQCRIEDMALTPRQQRLQSCSGQLVWFRCPGRHRGRTWGTGRFFEAAI